MRTPSPPEMTCGFLIQMVFCRKKTMWFIGVEVEQETSAPPPKKDPGTAPETLLKMRPNYSRSSRENATPSSGTSPLASYKEVPPSPGIEMAKRHHAHARQSAFIHSFLLSTSPLSLSPMGFLFLCAQIVSGCLIFF